MPSHYMIVRYVPDPIAEERINIGVLAFGGGVVRARFLNSWDRARRLGRERISYLKEIAERFADRQTPLLADPVSWSEGTMTRVSRSWRNSIQLSEPRASLKSPDDLVEEVADRYLKETTRAARTRAKSTAAALGLRFLRTSFRTNLGRLSVRLLKSRYDIPGKFDNHRVDVAGVNGRTLFAAEAISFEVSDPDELKKDVESVAWTVDDLRKAHRTLRMSVLALPPAREMDAFNRARRIYTGLGAKFVVERQFNDWARETVQQIGRISIPGRTASTD